MKLLSKIHSGIKNTSTKAKVALSLVLATAVLSGVAYAGWSPNRPVFNWNDKNDRKGSLNGPRMNAFINTPSYGDERAFFDARKPGESSSKDVYHNVTNGGQEVILRTFVHNGANQSTNKSGKGVAKNAKVRVDLPTGESHALRARSYISISNPAPGYPGVVTDTAELVSSKNFSIKYIPGSAKMINNAHPNGIKLSDNIVKGGAQIGYKNLNGEIPGCFEYAAFVEIRVKIQSPESDIQKQVRKAGTTQYGELATVKPGEKVEWLIRQDIKGNQAQNNVQVFDALPKHLQVVPGSVRWIYKGSNGQDQDIKMSDTDLFTKLVDFGTWQPNTYFYLRFDTTAKSDFEGCEVTLTNQARSKSQQRPDEQRDNAQVKIIKENCEPAKPKYACDLLSATVVNENTREVKFTAQAHAAGGATIERYIYNFGDGTEELATDKSEVTHTYAKNGEYTAKLRVEVKVNGETKIAESQACQAMLTFDDNPDTPVVPENPSSSSTAPENLPDTGPGAVVATFAAVTMFSAVAYHIVVRRISQV